jgi:hypothetical protein
MSTVKDYTPTQDAQNAVNRFTAADQQFKSAWDEFYQRHQTEIDQLEALRESRNVALDESAKMLRDEATRLDINRYKSFKFGVFQVQKKQSDWYRAEEYVSLAKDLGCYKRMVDEGAIAVKIEINREAAQEFMKKNSLTDKFATTLDSKELTPAVLGPKIIPALGQELKGGK